MDEERSCYSCKYHSVCYLRRGVYEAIIPRAAWMLEGAPRAWTDIFVTLAETCIQYEKEETANE